MVNKTCRALFYASVKKVLKNHTYTNTSIFLPHCSNINVMMVKMPMKYQGAMQARFLCTLHAMFIF